MSIKPKVFVSNKDWLVDVKDLPSSQEVAKFSYIDRNPSIVDGGYKRSILDRIFELFRPKLSVGGIPIEGLIPLLDQGIDLLLNNPVVDSKTFQLLELYTFYDFVRLKTGKFAGKILQFITDYNVGETGDLSPEEKSITFIWSANLTENEFNKSIVDIPEIRRQIKEKLKKERPKEINHIECYFSHYSDGWQILWVEKQSATKSRKMIVPPFDQPNSATSNEEEETV